MNPRVNKETCIGCGICPSICPEVFTMSHDGKAEVIGGADYSAHTDKIKESIESCPTKAISA